MPLSDLIYGPPRDRVGIRPTLVDMDTVREVVAKAEAMVNALELTGHGPAIVTYTKRAIPGIGGGETVTAKDLDALSPFDRNTLQILVQRGPGQASISFLDGAGSAITVHSMTDPNFGVRARAELEQIVLDNGRPIWRPHRFAFLLPALGAAVFVGLWVWLLLVVALPLPAVILGCIISGGVAVVALRRSGTTYLKARAMRVRHRIRTETRAESNARRTDARMNLKVGLRVAVVTAVLALPTGFALAVLTNAFGLKA